MKPDLAAIVRERGGALYKGGTEALVPGPGHSRKDRSLSLKVEGDRITWFSFPGDSNRDVMDYLGIGRTNDGPRLTREEQAQRQRERDSERRVQEREALAFCETVWKGTQPLAGTPAAAYLASRGHDLSACPDLRFHPAAPRSRPQPNKPLRTAPALVALVRDVTGGARGIHVTFVHPDGSGKAFGERSRLMFGPVSGGAVRLFPIGADGQLAVGEGIESSASYAGLHGVPTWAALSTSGLATFTPPYSAKSLVVAADSDDAPIRAGMMAARALVNRARCPATIDAAPEGKDWGDVWEADRV